MKFTPVSYTHLELPERLSPNALLEVLNALFTFGELEDTVRGADAKKFS